MLRFGVHRSGFLALIDRAESRLPAIAMPQYPNPDEPVGAKRKSRFIRELKIEDCKFMFIDEG